MSFLLDTNVVSELRKADPHPNVRAWRGSVDPDGLYVSVLVVGEIRRGIERLRRHDRAQADVYENWLGTLRRDYADHVLPVSEEIAERWGQLGIPDPVPVVDGLMAATAQVHGLTFVTRNPGSLARSGVRLLNPFEA